MKQLLLATALIAVPVAGFTGFNLYTASATVQTASLGDLSSFKTIITDVQTIAATGDFVAAETRITDFESAWDDAATAMRPLSKASWGNVDDAADGALSALRADVPVAGDVTATLATLMMELDNPAVGPDGAAAATVAATAIGGITVTDENGRPLPCEDMLATLAATLTTTTASDADKISAVDFQTKALERCNADDDTRADGYSAQALALLSK